MSAKVLSAGDYIASKCSKCKDITNHTIVAMVGEMVKRVECNTCGSVHNHRAEPKKKAPQSRSTTAAKPRATSKSQRTWESLLEDADPAQAVPYSMSMSMKEGQLIQHPSFGIGVVMTCIRPNKMEVQFQSGVKLLRCKLD